MDEQLKRTIAMLDEGNSNYGYANNDYGYGNDYGYDNEYGAFNPNRGGRRNLPTAQMNQRGKGATNYSVNSAIAAKTQGTSTFQVQISCAKTGTGSGNTYNPIFLFGGEAFSNASKGYLAVRNANQVTALTVANNKNVITFKYSTDANNYSVYTVTLVTDGEYPFIMNSLSGVNKMDVVGTQIEISDVAQTAQLKQSIQTFFLDEFGKSTTNDLTTPKDLYQQQNDGIFLPHKFEISGKRGIITNVLEIEAFSVTYYMYAIPGKRA